MTRSPRRLPPAARGMVETQDVVGSRPWSGECSGCTISRSGTLRARRLHRTILRNLIVHYARSAIAPSQVALDEQYADSRQKPLECGFDEEIFSSMTWRRTLSRATPRGHVEYSMNNLGTTRFPWSLAFELPMRARVATRRAALRLAHRDVAVEADHQSRHAVTAATPADATRDDS